MEDKNKGILVIIIALVSVLSLFVSSFRRAYAFYVAYYTTPGISVTGNAPASYAKFDTGPNVSGKINNLFYSSSMVDGYGRVFISWCNSTDPCYSYRNNGVKLNATSSPKNIWAFVVDIEDNTIYISSDGSPMYLNEDASYMFSEPSGYLEGISRTLATHIDASTAKNMSGMFRNIGHIQGPADVNISGWNTGSVNNMAYMFSGSNFNTLNTAGMNVASVENLGNIFMGTVAPNISMYGWDLSSMNVAKGAGNGLLFGTSGVDIKVRDYIVSPNSIKSGSNLSFVSYFTRSENMYLFYNSSSPRNTVLYIPKAYFASGSIVQNALKSKAYSLAAFNELLYCNNISKCGGQSSYSNGITVSTSGSPLIIKIIKDQGNTTNSLYYYTQANSNVVYLGSDASYMFANFNKVKDITQMENWNTSRTYNFHYMFYNFGSSANVNLYNWRFDNSQLSNANVFYMFNRASITRLTTPANIKRGVTINLGRRYTAYSGGTLIYNLNYLTDIQRLYMAS